MFNRGAREPYASAQGDMSGERSFPLLTGESGRCRFHGALQRRQPLWRIVHFGPDHTRMAAVGEEANPPCPTSPLPSIGRRAVYDGCGESPDAERRARALALAGRQDVVAWASTRSSDGRQRSVRNVTE